MILKMVSATTSQCFIKATDKNKVNLAERLSSFAQVTGNPTQMDLQLQLHLMQTDQPMPTPNEEDGRLPKPVSGLSWLRARDSYGTPVKSGTVGRLPDHTHRKSGCSAGLCH